MQRRRRVAFRFRAGESQRIRSAWVEPSTLGPRKVPNTNGNNPVARNVTDAATRPTDRSANRLATDAFPSFIVHRLSVPPAQPVTEDECCLAKAPTENNGRAAGGVPLPLRAFRTGL